MMTTTELMLAVQVSHVTQDVVLVMMQTVLVAGVKKDWIFY